MVMFVGYAVSHYQGSFIFIELPIEDQLQTIMLHRFNSTMHVHVIHYGYM